jgi:hypothetical protein
MLAGIELKHINFHEHSPCLGNLGAKLYYAYLQWWETCGMWLILRCWQHWGHSVYNSEVLYKKCAIFVNTAVLNNASPQVWSYTQFAASLVLGTTMLRWQLWHFEGIKRVRKRANFIVWSVLSHGAEAALLHLLFWGSRKLSRLIGFWVVLLCCVVW